MVSARREYSASEAGWAHMWAVRRVVKGAGYLAEELGKAVYIVLMLRSDFSRRRHKENYIKLLNLNLVFNYSYQILCTIPG